MRKHQSLTVLIMRDVSNGWLIRYLHSNTASAFFFLVCIAYYCFYLCVYNYCNDITLIFYNFDLMSSYNKSSLLKSIPRLRRVFLLDPCLGQVKKTNKNLLN